ncbi:hypothetical protein HX744_26025 [Pseudonocardia sp. ICBG1122]|nr:hypothetical protein [Pseudonocardia pini]
MRTTKALVDAGVEILRANRRPTVADAAAVAGMHRATACRCFPTPESLRSEAALTAGAPSAQRLVEGVSPDDPFALLDAVVVGFAAFGLVFGAEAVVVTLDVCGLDPAAATEVMRWSAPTILTAVLDPEALRLTERGRRP